MRPTTMVHCGLLVAGILVPLSGLPADESGPADLPASYTGKLALARDLTQTDRAAGLPAGGVSCCGPVAISNSMFAFAELGYPRLSPEDSCAEEAHRALARLLASDDYTAAGIQKGTDAGRMIRGAARYVSEQGYTARFEFQGWRSVPSAYRTGDRPEREWICRNLLGPRAVWFNIGWYRYDQPTDTYHRTGGHWVTAVGYGVDPDGNPDPDVLIIYDPSPRSGFERRADYVRCERLASGRLSGPNERHRQPGFAEGLLRLGGGLQINRSKGDTALLDGVLVMTLQPAAADEAAGDE